MLLKRIMQFVLVTALFICAEVNMTQYRNAPPLNKNYRKWGILAGFCYTAAGVLVHTMAAELWSD